MSFTISLFSDLHLDENEKHEPLDLSHITSDVVVLAGDIHSKCRSVPWILDNFDPKKQDVIIIDGNHEFYGGNIQSIKRTMRETVAGTGIHYLDNSYVDLHGVRFIGATLWTDFELKGNALASKGMAQAFINDFKRISIKNGNKYQTLTPGLTQRMHWESRRFIADTINKSPLPTIVISHHLPSMRSVATQYQKDLLCAAFASDMDDFICKHPCRYWFHGHSHDNADYWISGTHVLSNQRGHVDNPNPQFNPNHQIIVSLE